MQVSSVKISRMYLLVCCILLFVLLPEGAVSYNLEEKTTNGLRSLRGGSYSRGGGSWSSRSSSSSSRNSNRSNNGNNRTRNGSGMSGMGRMLTGLAVAGIGLALLGIMFPALGMALCGCLPCCMAGACCGLAAAGAAGAANNTNSNKQQQYNAGPAQGGANNNMNDQRYSSTEPQGDHYAAEESAPPGGFKFEAAAQRAKQEVESSSTTKKQQPYGQPLAQPYSGQYSTSYVDRTTGVQHNASLNISFTPDFYGTGFQLSGEGHDIDGATVIEDGHVNCDGTSWWRERTISGDVGLKVLSRGKFDFEQRSFNGTWLASTMEHGAYIIFRAASGGEAPMMQPQPYVPLVAITGNSNIPVVSASQVVTTGGAGDFNIPLVSATVVSSISAAATPTAYPASAAYADVAPANTGGPTVYVSP